jgi:hypothetical protein
MLDTRYWKLDWIQDSGMLDARIKDSRCKRKLRLFYLYLVSCICAIEHPESRIEHLPCLGPLNPEP